MPYKMAYSKQYHLTLTEEQILRQYGMTDDIGSESRRLNRTIQRRLENWTTCTGNYAGSSDVSILLFGMGGVGKSALGNLLLDYDAFQTCNSAIAETNRVCGQTRYIQGRRVTVYDTPGYLMRALLEGEASPLKALNMGIRDIDQGAHILLLVMSATNMRNLDSDVQLIMKANLLNHRTFRYCILVATRSKANYKNHSVYDYIQDASQSPNFAALMDNIDRRVVLVESGSGGPFDEDNAFYSAEKECGRDMIFNMIGKVINSNYGTRCMTKDMEKDLRKCFPHLATVSTPQGKKTMAELALHEEVLVVNSLGQAEYEKVIMFSHTNRSHRSYFCTISTEDGKVLQLSPGHLLHIGDVGKLVPAQDVKVGDVVFTGEVEGAFVKPAQVTATSGEWLTGIYCPHTPSGSVIVDGVAASCYTNLMSPTLAHAAMFPVRVAHRLLPHDWFRWIIPYNQEQGMPSLALKVSQMMKWS